jgi:type I restriction enzyme S subunit
MSLPRYPKYKDSGVEWLGEVPEHWKVISIKWLSPVKRGASPRPIDDQKYFDDGGEYAWVRIADVSSALGILEETTQRLSELGSSLSIKIQPGALFVSIAGTVGKPCITAIQACIHDGFVYFPALRIDPKFLYRIFEAGTCYAGLGKWGTQLNLNTDTIGSIRIALPPQEELRIVLAFLDRETAKIDALVEEQRRLIELLKEKRHAVISHAVTKGLNPHAKMKPSGIEWLGDVPAHWDVFPLKRDLKFLTSGSRGWAENYSDEGDLFIRIGNLTRDSIEIDLSDIQRVVVPPGSEGARTSVQSGDVLFSITAYLGSVAIVPEDIEMAYVSQHVALARLLQNRLSPRWVGYVTLSNIGKTYLETQGYGGTKIQLSLDDVANLLMTVPPLDEQTTLTNFLDLETSRFDALTGEATRAIDLLQERRTALISAAVTGKIDVRGESHVEQ